MPNTYTQIYLHFIFVVKGRESLLNKKVHEDLFRYFNSIINLKTQKLLALNGYLDHLHLLISIDPNKSISDLVKELKVHSTKFIKGNLNVKSFSWQGGYACFSYGASQLSKVKTYIAKQEEHHKSKSFKEEYERFLKAFNIPYDERYVFEYLDLD
ncbi:MAG TPA: IS200/IS605 family transposase [Ignavibacteriaceae bacterium]|nr:IS200/IS605 family transposase [Ignavibacteriaceae bacterium]